jgi:DNA-binding transcriptional LysR family regulator
MMQVFNGGVLCVQQHYRQTAMSLLQGMGIWDFGEDMRIESMMLCLDVVQSGSITAAAKRSFITQQGASSAIKSLEQDLGVKLFSRHNNTLVLTDAGKMLLPHVQDVIRDYNALLMSALAGALPPRPLSSEPIRIITTPLMTHVFEPIFEACRATMSGDLHLECTEKTAFEIIRTYPALDDRALYIINIPPYMSTLSHVIEADFEPLLVSDLVLMCASDHPFAHKTAISSQDLMDARFACYNEDLVTRLVRHVLKDVPNAKITIQTTNETMLHHAILEQGMVGFTDSFTAYYLGRRGAVVDELVTIPLDPPLRFTTGILGRTTSSNGRLFAELLKRYLETVCADYLKANAT